MKVKLLLAITLIIVSLVAIIGAMYRATPVRVLPDKLFGWKVPISELPASKITEKAGAYSTLRTPNGIPQGLPVRLVIPSIGVNSAIEDAVVTPEGRMDVPAGSVDVAWFALGSHPGQIGSAVVGGHYGIQNGIPFVFYKLDQVKVGEKIYIINDRTQTLTFVVRSIKSFDRNADPTSVFTSTDGLAHLNLITCEGVWNQVNGTYPQRLVLFTDEIPTEIVPPVIPKLPRVSFLLKNLFDNITNTINKIIKQ